MNMQSKSYPHSARGTCVRDGNSGEGNGKNMARLFFSLNEFIAHGNLWSLSLSLPETVFNSSAPLFPAFSSGQFASIHGTKNPSRIQALKPPFNRRRPTVWPYTCACVRLGSPTENHGGTYGIIGLKIKGFRGELRGRAAKRKSRANDIEKNPSEWTLTFDFARASVNFLQTLSA